MAIGLGLADIKIALGGYEISKISLGDESVYSAGNIVTYYVDEDIEPYTEEVGSGDSCLSPTTFTPEKSGWTFVGWRKDTTASETVEDDVIMEDEPITLYAVYSKVIILSYNGNSATSGSTEQQKDKRYFNADGNYRDPSFTLRANGFTRTDYTFTKWAMGSASGTQYAVGDSVTLSESKTFYALWEVGDKTVSVSTNYSKSDTWYGAGSRTTLGTFYTSVDKSMYSSAQLTLSDVTFTGSYAWADSYIYLTDGTTDVAIAHIQRNASDGYQINTKNLNPTLTFKTSSGTANLSLVIYSEEANSVSLTVKGGTLKLIGRK